MYCLVVVVCLELFMTLEDNWKKIGVEHVARPNVRWSRIVIILYLACYAVLVLDLYRESFDAHKSSRESGNK